mgnify:CR=1 FL=1
MSGNDAPVRDYVMSSETARKFLDKLVDMVQFLIPNYVAEGKNQLVIGIGCTGGKHRSVTLARELYSRLSGNTNTDSGWNTEMHRKTDWSENRKDDKGEMSFFRDGEGRTFQTDWIGQTLQNGRTGCDFMFLWGKWNDFFRGQ